MAGPKREARLRAGVPAILVFAGKKGVDARVKPGHDEWRKPGPYRRLKPHISLSFPDFEAKSPPTSQPPHPWRLAAELSIGRVAAYILLQNKDLDKWRRPSRN